jgi:cytochrome c5
MWGESMQIKKAAFFLSVLLASACSSEKDKRLTLGQGIYTQNCKVCHSQGINGAPVYGNKNNWSKRAPQGIDVLVQHAMNGYGLMPAKGGKTHLQEPEIRAAITYMLAAIEE